MQIELFNIMPVMCIVQFRLSVGISVACARYLDSVLVVRDAVSLCLCEV